MKKKILISCLLMFFIVGVVFGVASAETDLREVSWGMNQDEVIDVEGTPEESTDNELVYDIEISGVDLFLAYEFIDDTLVKAHFVNNENYMDDSHYYDDYKTLNDSLKQIYGNPDEEIENWDTDMFESMYSEKMGFQIGVVEFVTTWEKERIKIAHILTKEDILDSTHGFMYESLVPEHQDLIESAEQEELEEQL